ncbi:FUSC family protein [Streptacidiphilus monticola]|uniref:FUSC family protein n=1 Tax=Streptacidiphilus monticola TaxID=2161674 RepID=A0ABW1G020_9ACTN
MVGALAFGAVSAAIPLALGAMFAGVNDRPGSRRSALARIGVPALGGAVGLGAGQAAQVSGLPVSAAVLGLGLVGLVAGGVSAVGPVASAVGTQLLITAALGWGIATPLPAWAQSLCFLGGAAWLLALRVALPAPGRGGPYLLDGERGAVADAYQAVAALLEADGPSEHSRRRAALSAALDRAQDALTGPRLRRGALGAAERRLRAQFAAVHPLAEAATALAWEGERLPTRVARGPRRLAEAVRDGGACGPLPAPGRATAAQRAFDDALLAAAQTFGTPTAAVPAPVARRWARGMRAALGPAGREYGLRVALATAASTAAAQALHPAHWYWLPVTAAFLVKPDLGPLVSRTLNRVLGTVVGAGVFGVLAPELPGTLWLPVAVVAVTGALIPLSLRHFALQTGVITVLVLTLVGREGGAGLVGSRIEDTLLACALVLLVGHVPIPGHHGVGVALRRARAERAAGEYLRHVLAGAGADPVARGRLRRAAYRELGAARAGVELAAAELPSHARPALAAAPVLQALERLVDTATAAAVELDHGEGELPPRHRRELERLLGRLPSTG